MTSGGGSQVRLFGGFELADAEGRSAAPQSRRARELIAYLLLRPTTHQRAVLVGAFWPDLPEDRGRRRLSQAMWQVGLALEQVGAEPPHATRDTIELTGSDLWVDVRVFDELVELGDVASLERAVELYRGELLAGYYEDWLLADQDRYLESFMGALFALMRQLKSRGDLEGALRYARLAVGRAPLREEGHREVMRLCQLLGRTSDAVEQYRQCRAILLEELGVEPEPETVELAERIERDAAGAPSKDAPEHASPAPVTEPPFVGREAERTALVSRLEQLLGSDGGVVLVEGDVGVGKTRLLNRIADDAAWRDISVATGVCPAIPQPYGPFIAALEEALTRLRVLQLAETVNAVWLRELARLLPAIEEWVPDLPGAARLEPSEEQTRLREALVRTLLAASQHKPLMLVIEDVHHVDADTLAVIESLAARACDHALLLCLSYRRDEAQAQPMIWDAMRNIDQAPGTTRMQVEPFSLADTTALVRGAGFRLDGETIARLDSETGGNPLFTLETLRAATEDETGAFPVATTVHEVIGERLRRLARTARTVLDVMAVDGRPLRLDDVAELTELSPAAVSHSIEDLMARSLLTEDADEYRFAHEQIRRVTYAEIAQGTRSAIHGRVSALVNRQSPGDSSVLAHHLSLAGDDAEAARHHARAGDEAATALAFTLAADHYAAVLASGQLFSWPPDQAVPLLFRYEAVLDILGMRARQGEVLDRIETIGTSVQLLLRRALLLSELDRYEEAVDVTQVATARAEAGNDLREAVEARTTLGRVLSGWGRASQAVGFLESAAAAAPTVEAEAEARKALGSAFSDLQRYDDATAELTAALGLWARAGNERGRAEVLGMLARVDMEQGDALVAEQRYTDALELCRRIGYRRGEGVNEANLGNLRYASGHMGLAFEHYDRALDVFRSIPDRQNEAVTLVNLATVRHSLFGNDEQARLAAEGALRTAVEIGDERGQAQCLDVLGSVALSAGDRVAAQELLRAGRDKARQASHGWLEAQLLLSLGRLGIEAGDPEAAMAELEAAEAICTTAGLSELLVNVRSTQAAALLDLDKVAVAAETSADAVSTLSPGVMGQHLVWWTHARVMDAIGMQDERARATERAHRLLEESLKGLSESDRRRAWSDVPVHAAIFTAWERSRPVLQRLRLPDGAAPTGRPLRDTELVDVEWTVSHPDDDVVADPGERRQQRILRLVGEARQQGAAPTVEDLAMALAVSRSTIRRDLATLRTQGHEIPTRGARP